MNGGLACLLQRWRSHRTLRRARRAAGPPRPDPQRWVVADVESSGLDPHRDHLLAVAAVALRWAPLVPGGPPRPQLLPGDSFACVLRPPPAALARPDKANILVHGIGLGTQRGGSDPAEALRAWAGWLGDAPLIGYHADFDRCLIDRACMQALGRVLPNPWVDLEPLCAVLHRQPRRRSLDHWLARHGRICARRHEAAADALVTAQLLMALGPALSARGVRDWDGLQRLADSAAWLPGRG